MSFLGLIAKKITRADQDRLIEKLKLEILASVIPTQVILFGSASRYEMTVASDIDVIVTVTPPMDARLVQKLLAPVSARLNWPVDLLVYDHQTYLKKSEIGGVCFIASTEGRVIYQD